jgi:tripartite-type tricarboxylate transporter receptor subunit TctC
MALATPLAVQAQDFPSKPIHLVTSSAGGSSDFVMRLIAPGLSEAFGQQVNVENRSSLVLAEFIKTAPADGHSLMGGGSSLWNIPLLEDVDYDPLTDFAPVSALVTSPLVLVVHPSVEASTVQEFIDLAKANPGAMNYASPAVAGGPRLAALLFKDMAGIDIVEIPYGGSGESINALLGGEVQAMFGAPTVINPLVADGRLKALGVTSATESALVPGVPPISATVEGYVYASGGATVLFAPKDTPRPVIDQINAAVVAYLNSDEVKQTLLNSGVEVVASTPDELTEMMQSEMKKIGDLIAAGGVALQ